MDEMREKSGKEQQGEIEKIDLIEFLRSFQWNQENVVAGFGSRIDFWTE